MKVVVDPVRKGKCKDTRKAAHNFQIESQHQASPYEETTEVNQTDIADVTFCISLR